jgi:hypothetical protein
MLGQELRVEGDTDPALRTEDEIRAVFGRRMFWHNCLKGIERDGDPLFDLFDLVCDEMDVFECRDDSWFLSGNLVAMLDYLGAVIVKEKGGKTH